MPRRSCASCITPDLCFADEECGYGMVDLRVEKGRASALPNEITIGPLEFVWESATHELFINRGEEHVGTVEHIWQDTWEAFVREAKPYHGPG